MRTFPLVVLAAFAVGCAQTDDDAALPADTAQVAPAPAGLSLAEAAGTWRVNVSPADSDSVLNSYTLWASEDPTAWRLLFDGRTDTMTINTVSVDGDSIMTRFGPYSSMLRPNVQVVTETVGRMQDGRMVGTIVARYSVTTADSVVHLRFDGTRQ